jgi:osmoprotectant transport system ATP-binding protein
MISFTDVSKTYAGAEAVKNLTLRISDGELLVLFGPGGSGKTTTLTMVNRLVEPSSGTVRVKGYRVTEWDPIGLRRSIGYVSGEERLLPPVSVRGHVGIVPRLMEWSARRIDEVVGEVLRLVRPGPGEHARRHSGKEHVVRRRRIGLARALSTSPEIVLMDEPFRGLDPVVRPRLQDDLLEIQRTTPKTIVFATDDIVEAARLADRIAVMEEGRAVQQGTPAEVVASPQGSYVKSLVRRQRRKLVEVVARGERASSPTSA